MGRGARREAGVGHPVSEAVRDLLWSFVILMVLADALMILGLVSR